MIFILIAFENPAKLDLFTYPWWPRAFWGGWQCVWIPWNPFQGKKLTVKCPGVWGLPGHYPWVRHLGTVCSGQGVGVQKPKIVLVIFVFYWMTGACILTSWCSYHICRVLAILLTHSMCCGGREKEDNSFS